MIATGLLILTSCIYLVSGLYPTFGKCKKDLYEKRVTNVDISLFVNKCIDLSYIYIAKNDDSIYCFSERVAQIDKNRFTFYQFIYDNYTTGDDVNTTLPRFHTVDAIFNSDSTLSARMNYLDNNGKHQTVLYSIYIMYVSQAGVALIYRCSPSGNSNSDDVGILAADVTLGAAFEEGIKGALQVYNDLNFTGCVEKLNVCPGVIGMNIAHNKTNPGI